MMASLARNGFFQLFRFASRSERMVQIIGALAALCAGAALPMMTIFLGSTTELFVQANAQHHLDPSTQGKINDRALYLVYVAIFAFITNSIFTFCGVYAGLKISSRTRIIFLKSLLSQRAEYLDSLATGKVTEMLTSHFDAIRDGISEKVGLAIYSMSTFLTAFIVALIKDWRLALVMSSVLPAMFIPTAVLAGIQDRFADKALQHASNAASVAEEMLSAIRTTQSLGVPRKLVSRYLDATGYAETSRVRAHFVHGTIVGTIYFVLFGAYALAFWEGARLFAAGEVGVSDLITVLFVVIIGSFALGQGIRQIGTFSAAITAGRDVFALIDKRPSYDLQKATNPIPASMSSSIVFEKARFAYPSRSESILIKDLDLTIQAGKMTAIVGRSGSGKSTLLSILMRLYDLDGGRLLLDGTDIKDFDLQSLRSIFAIVEQDTAVFSKSILDNVLDGAAGRIRGQSRKEIKAMVVDACKMANAHGFVSSLPEGYETLLGSRGSTLSGGQRQRLAIARAIISLPQILILDEATAALDTVAEEAVMNALRNVMKCRPITIIVIAHRISSIRKADSINVIDQGRLVEVGSHEELLARNSTYCNLWKAGQLESTTGETKGSEPSRASIISNIALDDRHSYLSQAIDSMPPKGASIRKTITKLGRLPEKSEPEPVSKVWDEVSEIMRTNERDLPRIFAGLLFSFVCGAAYPLQALVFAHLLLVFGNPAISSLQSTTDRYCLEFFCLALLKFIGHSGAISQFGICKERMVSKIRSEAFLAILRKPIEWFEQEKNSTAVLLGTLAKCSDLEALHVATMALYFTVMVNLIGGSVISFIFAWQLACITTAAIPLFLMSAYLRYRLLSGFSRALKNDYVQAASMASEATSATRTVVLLQIEDQIVNSYAKALGKADRRSTKTVMQLSLLFGLSQSATFLINALVIWSGAKLISGNHIEIFEFFVAFISISFGAQDAGELFSYAPDVSRARALFRQLLRISSSDRGNRPLPAIPDSQSAKVPTEGHISFKSVSFSYPQRPSAKALCCIDLDIASGQHVALVGGSGSGKSTVIGLLERFFEPSSGQILVDGQDIRNYDIEDYRSSIGLVSQSPTLYDGSIAFNILLASNGNVTQSQLEEVCRKANILDFIQSLPEGFETQVGSHGIMLSGGQRQRMAIARVLLQDSPIFLFDEATSALDFHSEAIVQEALDRAMQGKTTITVAHRLSTIRHADCIYVFNRGRVVEKGHHDGLVELRKRYWKMLIKS